jgi:hypothetical protein
MSVFPLAWIQRRSEPVYFHSRSCLERTNPVFSSLEAPSLYTSHIPFRAVNQRTPGVTGRPWVNADIEKVLGKICQCEMAYIQASEDSDRQSRNLLALMSVIFYYYPKKKDRRAYYNFTTPGSPVPNWVRIYFCVVQVNREVT